MNKITNERTNIKKKEKQQQPPPTAYEVQTKRLQWIAFNWQIRNQTIWTFYWVSANLHIRIFVSEIGRICYCLNSFRVSIQNFGRFSLFSSHLIFLFNFPLYLCDRDDEISSWLYLSRVPLWFTRARTHTHIRYIRLYVIVGYSSDSHKQSNMEMSASAIKYAILIFF